MAQRKQIAAKDIKQSVTQALQAEERGKQIAEIAKQNLALSPTERWRTIAPEHAELVIARANGGETVAQICRDLDIPVGYVYQLAYMDPEFGQRLAIAREIGQHALVDKLLELPFDDTLTMANKELLERNIKWVASRVAKNSRTPLGNYNERIEQDNRSQTIIINLPYGDDDTKW